MGRLSGLQRGADAIVDAYNKQQAILQKEADYQRAKADMESERNRQRQERKDDEETQFQQVKMGLKKYMGTRESPNAPSQGPPELVSPSGGYQQESESAERIPFGLPGWATQAPAQPKGQMQGPPELIQPTTAQAPLNSAEMRQSAIGGLSGVSNANEFSGYKMGMDMFGKEDDQNIKSFLDVSKKLKLNQDGVATMFHILFPGSEWKPEWFQEEEGAKASPYDPSDYEPGAWNKFVKSGMKDPSVLKFRPEKPAPVTKATQTIDVDNNKARLKKIDTLEKEYKELEDRYKSLQLNESDDEFADDIQDQMMDVELQMDRVSKKINALKKENADKKKSKSTPEIDDVWE